MQRKPMSSDLATLIDEREIARLINQYGRSLDGGDVSEYLACFTEDADVVFEGSIADKRLHGHRELEEHFQARSEATRTTFRHLAANINIHVAGSKALADSYQIGISLADGRTQIRSFGRHHDILVKGDNGRWRIKSRLYKGEATNASVDSLSTLEPSHQIGHEGNSHR
jgi:uncharacterized protein (TIGR02246 family)